MTVASLSASEGSLETWLKRLVILTLSPIWIPFGWAEGVRGLGVRVERSVSSRPTVASPVLSNGVAVHERTTSNLGLVRAGGEPITGSWWFCFNAADAEVPDVGKAFEDDSFSLNDKSDFVVDAFPLMP